MLSIIVAMGLGREIGQNGDMPWHLPQDLKHFKQLTLNKTILMGRRTFESLPGVLPKRQHIVITKDAHFQPEHSRVSVSHHLEEALRKAQKSEEEIFVIGGGQIYQQALPFADRLYLTLIDQAYPQADTFFPEINDQEWQETERSAKIEENNVTYQFVNYQRIGRSEEKR